MCLTISLVSSSHALMSSARILSPSGVLPFFEFIDCSLQLFCRDLWDSRHLIGVVVVHISVAFISIVSDSLFRFVLLFVVVKCLQSSPKTLAIPLRDVMIFPFSFFIFVLSTFFFTDLIPGMFLTPSKSSSIFFGCLAVVSIFFVSDTFFMHLLTSFSRCFSSLVVPLLSSSDFHVCFDISSVSFAAAVSPTSSPSSPSFFTFVHVVADM